jgi:hypothetical protein
MSAPAQPAVEVEPPTEPLPVIPTREPVSLTLPAGSGLSTTHSVWLVPATVVAAIVTGTLVRGFLTDAGRFTLVVALLLGLLLVAGVVLVVGRVIER